MIRLATLADVPACEAIARQYPQELAFVRRVSFERGVYAHELYVAEADGRVAGFVSWHKRRDGWSTIYDLAVDREFQGQGLGRNLLYAVPCPMRLKCKQDNPANDFYRRAGMRLVGTQRNLNLYEMNVLNIVVRGNCKRTPAICRASGSAYGVQEHHRPYAPVFMLDVEFETPHWTAYLETVKVLHPIQALVIDYTDPSLKHEMLKQVQDLRDSGVLRVVVAVKFHGAVADIPKDCIVGISLRTEGRLDRKKRNKYAGFMPDFRELIGRRCHLLGGSPQLQKDTIAKLMGVGATVVSCDGNAQFDAAGKGATYHDDRWKRRPIDKADYYAGALYSTQNIQRELNAVQMQQLPLFTEVQHE